MMRQRRLLVMSSYPLLGEGLRSLLSDQDDLTLLGPFMMGDVAIGEVGGLAPDLLLIAGEDDDSREVLTLVLDVLQCYPDLPVIQISLSGTERVRVYTSQTLPARSADLLTVIRSLPVRAVGRGAAES